MEESLITLSDMIAVIRRRKKSLILPALGVMLTPWTPRIEVLLGMGLTLLATVYLLVLCRSGSLKPIHVLGNGLCYLAFVLLILLI